MYTQRSFHLSQKEAQADQKWWIIDGEDQVVGRVATQVATLLRGKHKPQFTPSTDSGDFVVVVNASKLRFTGKKLDEKVYHRHTGYMGGIKTRTAKEQMERSPERLLEMAVQRMLPKTHLGRKQIGKLKVYAGSEHNHSAQKPVAMEIKG